MTEILNGYKQRDDKSVVGMINKQTYEDEKTNLP